MATNYEDYYASEGPDALGPPSSYVTGYFKALSQPVSVLDVGCGQGRDALFIARLGHRVHGLDISPTGIAQMMEVAGSEGLAITAEVADLGNWQVNDAYDVLLLDRVLHMLPRAARLEAMKRLMGALAQGGQVVLLDESPNMADLIAAAQDVRPELSVTSRSKGQAILI